MLSALLNPSWLTATLETADFGNETVKYRPSVGVYAKCGKPIGVHYPVCTVLAVRGLATESHIYPDVWKAATVFLCFGKIHEYCKHVLKCCLSGLTITSFTVCTGLLSCCFQSIFKKSIFNISGAAQAIAGKHEDSKMFAIPTKNVEKNI